MEEDILNYSPTVMFLGTPSRLMNLGIYYLNQNGCILKRPWDGSTCVKMTRLILEKF